MVKYTLVCLFVVCHVNKNSLNLLLQVNGTNTLNENLADNGGVKQAYRAVMAMIERSNLNCPDDRFTKEQLFFIGFGTVSFPSRITIWKKITIHGNIMNFDNNFNLLFCTKINNIYEYIAIVKKIFFGTGEVKKHHCVIFVMRVLKIYLDYC